MIIQDEEITVILDNLVFTSYETPTIQYRLDEAAIEGWYDGAPMRRTEEPRPTQWGDFKTPGYLGSRLITLTGTAIAPDYVTLQAMRDEFMSTLINGQYAMMEVRTTSTGKRFIEVGLESTPKWTRKTDTFATFKLDLLAPDPRIYGIERVFTIIGARNEGGLPYPLRYPEVYGNDSANETQFVRNIGNADAWPTIVVTGNMPDGFSITDGKGHWVEYKAPVIMSAPITLDFTKGKATQKGQDRTTNLTKRGWFPIPPGGSVQPRFTFSGKQDISREGWIELKMRDTWI